MAGHSKWANIKFRKAAQDSKRGKIFTKLIREITVAARMGGDDVTNNPRLRDAIDKGLKANMKRDTINNAVKRGAGGLDGADLVECRYEGYGVAGVAVLVDCLTDNKNRTVAEVRHAFTKYGGNLGTTGSVAFQFTQRGELYFQDADLEEQLLEQALELGAEDVDNDGEGVLVVTSPELFIEIKEGLQTAKLEPDSAEITFTADNKVDLDKDTAEKLLRMVDVLEELDDVQNVYTNADISDEVLAELT